jgi:hypothetical protein
VSIDAGLRQLRFRTLYAFPMTALALCIADPHDAELWKQISKGKGLRSSAQMMMG